ncbi:nucleotide disphospho-sugar-binding domain-containing protein [Actinophytocola sp.]|uniref:nucleotide disphospho-sugar-binding domain-containing protein n=1 Tax=Actinophytocola sp. TaxID=1872138 RepID=UPI002ED46787
MRVLMTVPAVPERLHHLVPLAWALRTAGHLVRVAGPPEFTETINLTGLVAVADDLVDHADLWRPDLVVWDDGAPDGALAARAVAATSVRVVGLPGGTSAAEADLTLDSRPPSLRDPEDAGHRSMRFVPYAGPAVVPVWLRRKPRRRRVCVTAGAAALVAGFGGVDAEVVCAADQVPPDVGVPGNVRLVEELPVTAVLPTCSAVVHDGMAHPVAAALAHGLPQLGPATDVFRRVVDQGAGLMADPESLGTQLTRLLTDPEPRGHAERLRGELDAMPSPHDLVPELARLATATRT